MRIFSVVAGLVLVISCWVWAFGAGGNPGQFVDIRSFILVMLLVCGAMVISFTPRELVDACRAMVFGHSGSSFAVRRRRVSVMEHAYQVCWGAGIFGTLSGLIALLADLSDPSSIGQGMVVALMPTFYAAILAEFVFASARLSLQTQLNCDNDLGREGSLPQGPPRGVSGLWRGATVVLLIFSAYLVMLLGSSITPFSNAPNSPIQMISEDASNSEITPLIGSQPQH